jgi:hypothetical protein
MKNYSSLWWITTSFFGSFIFTTICTALAKEAEIFLPIFVISMVFSTVGSIPVWIFAHFALKKGTEPRSVLNRIRNFQLLLCGLFVLGLGWPILHFHDYTIEETFWYIMGILLLYLLTGFVVWWLGIVYRSNKQ